MKNKNLNKGIKDKKTNLTNNKQKNLKKEIKSENTNNISKESLKKDEEKKESLNKVDENKESLKIVKETKEINKNDEEKKIKKDEDKKESLKKVDEIKEIKKSDEEKEIKKGEDKKEIKKDEEKKEIKKIDKEKETKKDEELKKIKKTEKLKKDKKEINKGKLASELEKDIDYKYNEIGELVHKKTGKKCNRLSKNEYEKVGKYVQKYIEEMLIKTFDLTILYVPNKISSDFTLRDENQAQCKILTTKDFPTNPKCLMLIQGSGAVRLGQWARSVCINENIDLGSMKPYIEKAIQNSFSVIIYNPNERRDFANENKKINEFTNMEKHSVYVYNNIVRNNKEIKEIYIVAHSMGGECTIQILLENKEDLLNGKIKKIAFTDSVYGKNYLKLGKKGVTKFREISRNYVGSFKPVGEFVKDSSTSPGGVDCYSSGDKRHEYTSGKAIEKVFDYFLNEKKTKIKK